MRHLVQLVLIVLCLLLGPFLALSQSPPRDVNPPPTSTNSTPVSDDFDFLNVPLDPTDGKKGFIRFCNQQAPKSEAFCECFGNRIADTFTKEEFDAFLKVFPLFRREPDVHTPEEVAQWEAELLELDSILNMATLEQRLDQCAEACMELSGN